LLKLALFFPLFRDLVPTVILKTWDLNATLYDSDVAAGPVPTLFTDDPEGALNSMKKDLMHAFTDINKVNLKNKKNSNFSSSMSVK